jgi:hypothetical protein
MNTFKQTAGSGRDRHAAPRALLAAALVTLWVAMTIPFLAFATSTRQSTRASAPSQTVGQKASPSNASAAAQSVTWTKFQDSAERSFSLEVPQGWTVRGGLFRLGYSDQRPMVDMTSPDGKINVRLGDVTIPSYVLPSQFHEREGEVYDLGAQAQMVVARYRTGPDFAVLYSHVRFYRVCQNPSADVDDVDFAMQDYLPADSASTQTSTGRIAYRCSTSGGPRVAFVYVRTSLYGTIWQTPALASFLAPADQVSLAKNVLLHAAQTFRLNPQWLEYQKQMDAYGLQYQRALQQQRMQALAQQVQQFQQKMQAMQNQVNAFERHQQAQSAQVDSFSQALRGVTPTTDPLTGESREVWTGPNSNYYANGLGEVVNSNTPPPGWHQLTPQ